MENPILLKTVSAPLKSVFTMRPKAFGARTIFNCSSFTRLRKVFFLFVAPVSMAVSGAASVITSPDAQTKVEISETNAQISYSVTFQNRQILMPSRLDLLTAGKLKVIQTEMMESDKVWKPTYGQFSEVRDQYNGMTLHLKVDGGDEVLLECRVFNDGVGLRFTSGGQTLTSVDKINFQSEYHWAEKSRLYWTQGESEPAGPISIDEFGKDKKSRVGYPVVVDLGEGAYAAALESDLYSAKAFSLMNFAHSDNAASVLVGQSLASVKGSPWQTAWRVILVGKSPGDLLVSQTPLNLAAPCQLEDPSWIKPGKTMWDWRVHGYIAGDFTYGINTASYLRYIDFAAENNVQYLLIDDKWFTVVKNEKMEEVPEIDLAKVMAQAKARGVGVLLYYDRKKGVLADNLLFPQLSAAGAVGTKYGFMGNNADFTRAAIAAAAKEKLLIDFHDSPCPMTGVERTSPNLITREYCHAMLDGRCAFTPTAFLKMAMINGLSGPLDQNNGYYGLNGINAGNRKAGLKKEALGSFDSTVVSETARLLVIFSGLICLPDAPEEYLKKSDLFDFVRKMPATWNETRILNSKIGEFITTARRNGKEWFIGSVINEAGGELSIPLDFLAPNTTYDVTYYEDAPDANCKTNREAYRIRQGTVKKGCVIRVKLAPGGGHCMWIRPQSSFLPPIKEAK